MPRKTHSELITGTFVIAALATLVAVMIWLGGAGVLRRVGQRAVFYTPQSAGSLGLLEGAFVQVGDDEVGRPENPAHALRHRAHTP